MLAAVGAGGLYFYADYRFDQIKKVHAKHLIRTAPVSEQKPFTMLLVGSDTRAFVDNATQVNAFGSDAEEGGSRSDVTMAVRIDPAAKTVTVLSIPRDLWVDIPGDVTDISGMNRINAAFNSGPDLLIQTIEQDLHVPINHYASVDFPGFSGMVNALGGVTMDFPTAVKDQYSGLDVTTTGCQVVNGTTALELVRSRHLYYKNSEGEWEYDGQSDFSRIQRQDAFFRAVLAKLNATGLDPLTINAFLGAAVTNLTIDDTLTKSDLFNLAEDFKGLSSSRLDHRDAADHVFRDRRRGRRAARGPALRPEHDQRIQRDRDGPCPHDHDHAPQGQEDHHHDHGPHGGPQPGRRRRPQRVDGQRHRGHHGTGAGGTRIQHRGNRERLDTAEHGRRFRDPIRAIRHRGRPTRSPRR